MQARNSDRDYGWVFWTLHWTSATLFLLVAIVATSIDGAADPAQRADFVGRHASLGQALLAVMVARLVWRVLNPNPVWSYPLPRPRKRLAVAVHWCIHVTVLTELITGLALLGGLGSAVGPGAGTPAGVLSANVDAIHDALPNVIYLLLLTHILAAALHQVSALQARPTAGADSSD